MPDGRLLTDKELNGLRDFSTCMIANAVETFNVRLHNTGFTDGKIRCLLPDQPPMVGYAVTARLRSGEPPIGGGTFHDRADFWNQILAAPAPRILVLQDMDQPPGRGAFLGDVHAAILTALGCVGYVTNGAVRELPSIRSNRNTPVCRQRSGLPCLRPYLRLRSEPSKSTGWMCSLAIFCTEIGTAFSLCRCRLLLSFRPVAARLQRIEQKVVEYCRSE